MGGGPIALSYEVMEQAHSQILSDQASVNDTLETLASKLDSLEWTGDDREAYMAQRAEWDQSIGKLNELLGKIGTAVDNARMRYAEAEAANKARFSA